MSIQNPICGTCGANLSVEDHSKGCEWYEEDCLLAPEEAELEAFKLFAKLQVALITIEQQRQILEKYADESNWRKQYRNSVNAEIWHSTGNGFDLAKSFLDSEKQTLESASAVDTFPPHAVSDAVSK